MNINRALGDCVWLGISAAPEHESELTWLFACKESQQCDETSWRRGFSDVPLGAGGLVVFESRTPQSDTNGDYEALAEWGVMHRVSLTNRSAVCQFLHGFRMQEPRR